MDEQPTQNTDQTVPDHVIELESADGLRAVVEQFNNPEEL